MLNVVKNFKRMVAFVLAMAIMVTGAGFSNVVKGNAAVKTVNKEGVVGNTISFSLSHPKTNTYKLKGKNINDYATFVTSTDKVKDKNTVSTEYFVKLIKAGTFDIKIVKTNTDEVLGVVHITAMEVKGKAPSTTQKKATTQAPSTTQKKATTEAPANIAEITREASVGQTIKFSLKNAKDKNYALSGNDVNSAVKRVGCEFEKDGSTLVFEYKLLKAGTYKFALVRKDTKKKVGIVNLTIKKKVETTESKEDKVCRQEAEKVAKAVKGKTDKQKIKYIHDYICKKTVYKENKNDQTAYGAIMGKAVCAGYSEYTKLLMNAAGIDCVVVESVEKGNHAWNLVKYNGKWYNMDVTWDDYMIDDIKEDFGKNVKYYGWSMLSDEDFGTVAGKKIKVGNTTCEPLFKNPDSHKRASSYKYTIATKSLNMAKW